MVPEERFVNVLKISSETNEHFVLITSISGLLWDRTKHNAALHYCLRCLHGFTTAKRLTSHQKDCIDFKTQRVEFPDYDRVKFKNFHKTIIHPIVVYADFESLIVEEGGVKKHVPCGFSFVAYKRYGGGNILECYRGKDAGRIFVMQMKKLYEQSQQLLKCNYKMSQLTSDEWRKHYTKPDCHICGKDFLPHESRARDHDHFIKDNNLIFFM